MRRYSKTLLVIAALVLISGLTLGFQTIEIRGFLRTGDNPLGLKLGLDLQGGSHLVYEAALTDASGERIQPTAEQMNSLRQIIERRANQTGLGEPIIQTLGEDRLLVQLPGVDDPARAKAIIGETAQLEFKHRQLDVPVAVELDDQSILSVTIDAFPEPVAAEETGETGDVADTEEAGATAGTEETELMADSGEAEAMAGPEETGDVADTEEAEAMAGTEDAEMMADSGETEEVAGTEDAEALAEEEETGDVTAQEGEDVAGSEEAEATAEEEEAPEPAVLLVELTDEGAEVFDQILERLLQSAIIFFSGGGSQPNRIQVDIDGDEFTTLTLQAGAVTRVEDTNVFAFALLDATGQPLAPTIEETRAIYGESPAVSFVEIYGAFDEDIGLTGDDLARAYAGTHQTTGQPIVNIEFNARGARSFGELTQLIINTDDRIAIFLDDEELIAPAVDQVITGGAAFIRGDFTPERAQDIAQLLEAGRLPIPIELVQERDVDAILGADSLRKSVVAGLVGLALVLVFMAAYYRVPGLVAAVALVIYGAIVLAVFKLIPVTLTLSGVAAAILSVGMAVDANILIFERMKDELRAGRTLLTSINIGFNRAWPAIRDGNVSTLITCAILFWFADTLGASVVQGFAATLAIGVLISMFSAIVVSRTLLRLLATTRISNRASWFTPVGKRFLPEGSR